MTVKENAPGYRAIRFNSEWITRPFFGFALAAIAIGALILGPRFFSGLVVLMTLFAAREWHRLVRTTPPPHGPVHLQTLITTVTIAAGILALFLHQVPAAFVILGLGTVIALVVALKRHDNALWQAAGVVYLGLPAFALTALRTYPAHGVLFIVGLFAIVWATDTGALVIGSIVGGRRLAPSISPGKTWSGTIGGSVCAGLAFAGYVSLIGGPALLAFLFGFVFSATAHLGDLFESFVKRRFAVKNSGSLIPGHGGVLDRMDSTYCASVVLALLVFGTNFNPFFGGGHL